jgi:hypothetical protein
MERDKLIKLLEVIEEFGYEVITFDASKPTRFSMEIGIPAIMKIGNPNPIDPKTGKELPQFL